jgi:C1A family cysteine protease
MVTSKEYTEYLKAHVQWEVTDYEENIFKGWTVQEFQQILGLKPIDTPLDLPQQPDLPNLPSKLLWADECDHGVKNQGNCGSCWAFGTVGMLASRCCLHNEDQGWLSPQELVSCDKKNNGCNGGSPYYALLYIIEEEGLVHDECFPYKANKVHCPKKCEDGKNWDDNHVCKCHGITECKNTLKMKGCLTTGPIAAGFGVCQSFLNYKSGIYTCDCQASYLGYHAILIQGYSDEPKCHWIVRNSWGENWGDHGYFKIECKTCGIDGELGGANMMCNKVT